MALLIRWKFPLFLAFLLSFLYLALFENRAFVEVEIQVPKKTWFNIYWAGEGKGYSRMKRARVRVFPGREKYRFFLADLRKVHRLRIDPHKFRGEVLIKKLCIRQNGFLPLCFEHEGEFSRLRPIFHIGGIRWGPQGLQIRSTGNDPQLELQVQLSAAEKGRAVISARIAVIFAAVFFFFFCTHGYREDERFIPLFFLVALLLVVVMAAVSKENVHPDEYVHLDAARYYKTNWLPPAVDDPAIRHTYSVYGVSRLNNREISYLFAGKLARLLDPLHLKDYLSLRLFNVCLLAGVLLFVMRNRPAALIAAPLLISPQLWYVFSYCNSDALALVVAFAAGCQAALPGSMLNTYLNGGTKNRAGVVLFLGFLCALLFQLKKNYYFFILFLFCYLFWRLFFLVERQKRGDWLKRFAVVLLVGAAGAGFNVACDYSVNGFDKAEKIIEMREKLAEPIYKPSTPLEKKHTFLYRRARGISLAHIIHIDRWFEKTFRSGFGLYGYFTVAAVDSYYHCVRWLGIGFLLFLIGAVVLRGGPAGNLLLVLCLACSAALIGASLYHSWTADFQTQGRYIFPIIPMFCIVLHHFRRLMQDAVYRLFVSVMFLLSLYSFIFVALMRIPKPA